MIENISQAAELVAALAGERGVPASGTVAGFVASLSASLVGQVADRSRAEWPEAAGAAAQAQALGRRALVLADRVATAYDAARSALAVTGLARADDPQRDWQLGQVVAAAADPPLALAGCASDIAQLAAAVAGRGAGELRANAVIAAKLAAAAADSAAHLVAINLVAGADPDRVRLAQGHARSAAEAARLATSVA